MAIKAKRTNFNTIVVRGINPKATLAEVNKRAVRYAKWLQRQISNLFEKERSVLGRLGKNKKAYNSFKARHGFDPRRGHKSKRLQKTLSGRKLYNVKISKKRIVTITVSEAKLRRIVRYAKFYENMKVTNGELMGFQKKWASDATRFFPKKLASEAKVARRRAA